MTPKMFSIFDYGSRQLYGSYTSHAAARIAVKSCGFSRYAILCEGEIVESVGEPPRSLVEEVGLRRVNGGTT